MMSTGAQSRTPLCLRPGPADAGKRRIVGPFWGGAGARPAGDGDARGRGPGGRSPRSGTLRLLALAALTASCAIPRWPVQGDVISPFGLRFRGLSPDYHEGVDVRAPEGTPVRARKPGVVERAGRYGNLGLAVYLDHGGGLVTIYGHLSRLSVERGQRVEHMQIVGAVGQTGNATTPHLHFEVLRNGRAVDPVPLLGGLP